MTEAGLSKVTTESGELGARLESRARAREVRHYIQYDPKPPV